MKFIQKYENFEIQQEIDVQPFYLKTYFDGKSSIFLRICDDIVDQIVKKYSNDYQRKNKIYTTLKLTYGSYFGINICFHERGRDQLYKTSVGSFNYLLGGTSGSYSMHDIYKRDCLGKRDTKSVNNNFIKFCFPIWGEITNAYKRLEKGEKFWDIIDQKLQEDLRKVKLLKNNKLGWIGFCDNKKMEEKYGKYFKNDIATVDAEDLGLFYNESINIQDFDMDFLDEDENYMDAIKRYLSNGGNPNIKNSDDKTLLLSAIENDNIDLVELLIEHDVDVNFNDGLATPLIDATSTGNYDIFKMLVDNGADVNMNVNTITPLSTAIHCENGDMTIYLLENGARLTNNILEMISEADFFYNEYNKGKIVGIDVARNEDVLTYINSYVFQKMYLTKYPVDIKLFTEKEEYLELDSKIKIEFEDLLDAQDLGLLYQESVSNKELNDELISKCGDGFFHEIKELVKQGADVNYIQNHFGYVYTPLIAASHCYNLWQNNEKLKDYYFNIMIYLLKKGADPMYKDENDADFLQFIAFDKLNYKEQKRLIDANNQIYFILKDKDVLNKSLEKEYKDLENASDMGLLYQENVENDSISNKYQVKISASEIREFENFFKNKIENEENIGEEYACYESQSKIHCHIKSLGNTYHFMIIKYNTAVKIYPIEIKFEIDVYDYIHGRLENEKRYTFNSLEEDKEELIKIIDDKLEEIREWRNASDLGLFYREDEK